MRSFLIASQDRNRIRRRTVFTGVLVLAFLLVGVYSQYGWAVPARKPSGPPTARKAEAGASFNDLAENPARFIGRGLVRFRPGVVVSDSIFRRGGGDEAGHQVTARILVVVDAAEAAPRGRRGEVLVAFIAGASSPDEEFVGKRVEVEGMVEQVPTDGPDGPSDENLLYAYLTDTARSFGLVEGGRQRSIGETALPYVRAVSVTVVAN